MENRQILRAPKVLVSTLCCRDRREWVFDVREVKKEKKAFTLFREVQSEKNAFTLFREVKGEIQML